MSRLLPPFLVGLALAAPSAVAQSPPPKPERAGLAHDLITRPWTGDFDGMVERRLIRVLTVYSKTFFFVDYVAYTLVQGEYLERMEARKQFLPRK